MKPRTSGVSLVEVIVAAGISMLIIAFTISASIAISKFAQQSLLTRVIDSQTTQGSDAIAKELRDGVSILSSATVAGKTYTTSSTCIVFSAVSYDFSKANPIFGATDTVVFTYAMARSQISRTCSAGADSKRPTSFESPIVTTTDAQFIYRVAEAIDWLNSSSTTLTETFKLAAIPSEQPSCTRNGLTIPCTWQPGSQSLSLQTPAGASMLGIQYKVSPSAATCPQITSVEIQVKRTSPSLMGTVSTVPHITEARLRNKR